MQPETQQTHQTQIASTEIAGEPYRFDERATSTGSAQADLAPVSPEPAASVSPEPQPTDDPMGASAQTDEVAVDSEANAAPVQIEAPFSEKAQAAPQTAVSATASSPELSTVAAPEVDGRDARQIETGLHASPETTLYWQDLSGVSHQTTISADINVDVSALGAAQAAISPMPAPLGPMPPASSTMPDIAFADLATRMDQMMADMMDHLGSNAEGVGTQAPIGPTSSLDVFESDFLADALEDFQSASDAFAANLYDLLTSLDGGLLGSLLPSGLDEDALLPAGATAGGLLSSLFTPGSDETSPFAGPPSLADVLAADNGVTELLGALDDDIGSLAGLDHDGSSGGLWDLLPDFG